MKETESPIEPVAETVRGLARDRSCLIEKRETLNTNWNKYRDYYQDLCKQIAAIDKRIDELILLDLKNVREIRVVDK